MNTTAEKFDLNPVVDRVILNTTYSIALQSFVLDHQNLLSTANNVSFVTWMSKPHLLIIECEREQLKDFLALSSGQWSKYLCDRGAHYDKNVNDVEVSIRTGLPPTCRVEYVEEYVPAQEARTVTRAKVVCDERTTAGETV